MVHCSATTVAILLSVAKDNISAKIVGLKSIDVLSTVKPSPSISAAESMHSWSTRSPIILFDTLYASGGT